MKETQRRIKAYKAALPGLKERIAAVAVLLAMSVAMMTSATFAWLTISRAPEITGVNTTVAANGNLEIALVPKDGSQPAESAVGDSSAAQGQSVTGANLTWGNLVNLSDPSYGLDNLTLRPAQLNLSALLTSPLYGAVYTQDGRVEKLNSSFAYAAWGLVEGSDEYRFVVTDDYGVRAISSTTIEAVGWPQQVKTVRDKAESANLQAGSLYSEITQNKAWMNSLAYLMGTFMTANLNAGQGDANLTNPTMNKEDIENLRDIFAAFLKTYEQQFVAEAELLNYQLFLKNNSEQGSTPYVPYDAEKLKDASVTERTLKSEGLQLTGFDTLKSDYNKLVTNFALVEELCETGTIKWADSGLDDIVNSLMNVATCTLDGTRIGSIGASNASGYLDGKQHAAVITNGVLYNFEKINGGRCWVEGLSVSAKVKRMGITVPASITVSISTNAPVPAQYSVDLDYSDTLNQGAAGTEIAQDTYGLAIDMWVRTNAPNSYLTLEGNVVTHTEEDVPVLGRDASGNEVNIYVLTRSTEAAEGEESTTYTIDLYKVETKDADGNVTATTWYQAESHQPVTLQEGETPVLKLEDIITVVGYEGENRVWEDSSMLSTDSTTQGSGSCYVYYADTPEDQARSLKLLGSMNVAFVDDKGTLLATAVMDTENYYAENGRVTVPLVLRDDSISLGEDSSGVETLAITALEQNVATRITAIVYLDGRTLSNADVLAASDIQGKLNIQFGSSQNLVHAEDEALENATRSVTASLEGTEFSYDTSVESGTPMTTTVTIRVSGDEPKNVSAFFLRAISSTQGSRENVIEFTDNGDGTWSGTYTFTAPGNYVLRSVELDGSTYDLASPQTVVVHGFTVESLSCEQAEGKHISIMTANSSSAVDLQLRFASSNQAAMPTTVQGRFLRADGTAVNINFSYNSTTGYWTGKANFVTSGEYTLQYLVLDGEYTELDSGLWQTASVYLGMKVAVYTDSPTNFLYLGDTMPDDQKNLYMKVKIMDNTGEEMVGLTGASLYYARQGSALAEKGMTCPLTWNASEGYYTGYFESKVGMFNFSTVTVGSNTISTATTAPAFKIVSPIPPTFNKGNTLSYQYSPNGDAALAVLINDCDAATVYADVLKQGSSETVEVEGKLVNDSWVFTIPADAEGKQDGVWTIQQLRLSDVYDVDGNEYTYEAPLVFDLTGAADVTAKVVSTITPVFTVNQSTDFSGKNFMETYTLSGLHVDIQDFAGAAVVKDNGTSLISDVKLVFTYKGSSEKYGGYTSSGLTNATEGATVTVNLTADSTGKRFVQTSDATFLYAGEYTTSFSFKVGEGDQKKEITYVHGSLNNMPVITVSTERPTVKVTGISTQPGTNSTVFTGTIASDGSVDYETDITGDFFRYDEYSAVVYITCNPDWRLTTYAPTVTLELDDICADFTKANIIFPNDSSAAYDVTYEFTPAELSATETIGHREDGGTYIVTTWNPKIFPAGKQTVEEIEVVYNGITFDVELSHEVTINQPQYPPYVDFSDIFSADTSFDGTTPSRVYSEDGETLVLPSVPATWTYQEGRPVNELVYGDYVEKETLGRYYYQKNWLSTAYHYHLNLYVRTGTVSSDIYSITKKVQWKIGDKIYNPGDVVEVSGAVTAIPIITVVSEQYVERKVVTYTEESQMYVAVGRGSGYTKIDSQPTTDERFNIKVTVS